MLTWRTCQDFIKGRQVLLAKLHHLANFPPINQTSLALLQKPAAQPVPETSIATASQTNQNSSLRNSLLRTWCVEIVKRGVSIFFVLHPTDQKTNPCSITHGHLAADGNHDGIVDPEDYHVWRSNFGASQAGAGQSIARVPESGALIIAMLAMSHLTASSNHGRIRYRHLD